MHSVGKEPGVSREDETHRYQVPLLTRKGAGQGHCTGIQADRSDDCRRIYEGTFKEQALQLSHEFKIVGVGMHTFAHTSRESVSK